MQIHDTSPGSGQPAETGGKRILAALDRLPEKSRLALWLRFRMGFETSEIAETLGTARRDIGEIFEKSLGELKKILVTSTSVADVAMELAMNCVPRECAPEPLLNNLCSIAHMNAPAAHRPGLPFQTPPKSRRPVSRGLRLSETERFLLAPFPEDPNNELGDPLEVLYN